MSNQILLVSSNTIDNIFDDKGRLIRQQPGGPARYCLSVLQIENIPYFLLTQNNIQVNIIVKKEGEQVKVFNQKTRTIPSQYLDYGHILISPVSNEWSLKNLDYSKNIYIDIQGYVRKQGEYDAKKKKHDLFEKAYSEIKGTLTYMVDEWEKIKSKCENETKELAGAEKSHSHT